MNVIKRPVLAGCKVCVTCAWLISTFLAMGAAFAQPLPEILEAGFASWAKGGAVDAIFMGWQRGGLMEGSNKAAGEARFFRNLSSALGNYKSHEIIQSKGISSTSQVLYVSINFERGVVYGRFLVYRSDKGWVVQNMDFSERPESIMPWLAYEGQRNDP